MHTANSYDGICQPLPPGRAYLLSLMLREQTGLFLGFSDPKCLPQPLPSLKLHQPSPVPPASIFRICPLSSF